jgi:uncharacterized protein (TIGR02266 family)
MGDKDERREHDRVKVELFVEEVDGSTTYFQRASNLSLGGIFLENTLTHPGGTTVKLKLELPDETFVEVKGEVVEPEDKESLGMRVRFLDLDDESKGKIDTLISKFAEMTESSDDDD